MQCSTDAEIANTHFWNCSGHRSRPYVLSRGIQLRPEIQDHGLRNTKYLPVRATPHRAPNNGTAENHTTTMILITRLLSVLRNDFDPTPPARAQCARIFLSLPDSRMVAFTMWNANSYGFAYFWNSKCDAARLLGHCSLPLHSLGEQRRLRPHRPRGAQDGGAQSDEVKIHDVS